MKRKIGTLIALLTSIAMIIIGLMQGQAASVLAKAARICLECIGIG